MDYFPVFLLLILGCTVATGIFILSSLIGPRKNMSTRLATYECGMVPEGDARQPFHNIFYLVAVFFLLFDVEGAFFFPWALVYRESIATEGAGLLIAILFYISIVVLGLLYIYRKKVLTLR